MNKTGFYLFVLFIFFFFKKKNKDKNMNLSSSFNSRIVCSRFARKTEKKEEDKEWNER